MFAFFSGTIAQVAQHTILIHNTLWGLEVIVPQPQHYKQGDTYSLYIYTHWNQDQGQRLYGFTTILERNVFGLLISCSGVGPKLALSLLQQISGEEVIASIASHDSKKLSSLQGIGPKKAEQLCSALEKQVQQFIIQNPTLQNSSHAVWGDVQQTLQSLHYSSSEINGAIKKIQKEYQSNGSELTLDRALKKALTFLSK